MKSLVLASGSPRRKMLLEAAGYTVDVRVPNVDETFVWDDIEQGALALAARKLEAVPKGPGDVALAADTLVILDGELLGKPASVEQAQSMLARLSGRTHQVITAFCVARGDRMARLAVFTKVTFRNLGGQEIKDYVATGEPMDKAGAYGIQGRGAVLVDRIEGSYTNVIGLPMAQALAAIEALTSP